MKSKVFAYSCAAALLVGAAQVRAAEPEIKAQGVATFGQLDELRSQNALLEAALKNADLRSKLAGGSKAQAASSAPGTMPTAPAAPAPQPARSLAPIFAPAPPALPVVELVASDASNRLVAILVLENGTKVKAYVGSTVQGLKSIKSISIDEVVAVDTKGKVVTLPSATEPTLGTGGGAPTQMPGMQSMQGMPGISAVMPVVPPAVRGGR
jgi:type IV pilus biogenesis protein PilP